MGDYLEDLVARQVTAHVAQAAALKGLAPPQFTAILDYFPLDAITAGQMSGQAWPLIDGQLAKTVPLGLSSTHFSAAYAGFVSNTLLQGAGTAALVALAKDQAAARINTTAAAPGNGGMCLTRQGNPISPRSYVPAYALTWDAAPGLAALSIAIDVWRANAGAPWQASKGQNGGETLRASLTYSDFRIVVLTPAPLQGGSGWYSPALLAGMRDGQTQGVSFTRMAGFGDTSGFIRAQAFAMVGRVQFVRRTNSTISLPQLMAPGGPPASSGTPGTGPRPLAPLAQMRLTGAGRGRLRLSQNLWLPHGRMKTGAGLQNALPLATSWDTGDIYTLSQSGFLVAAVPDAPLAAPPVRVQS